MIIRKYFKQILFPVFGIISILFLLTTTIGCNKEIEMADTLAIENPNLVVRASGDVISLDINSNGSWKVGNIGADWLHVDNLEGTGNGQLHLSCDENSTVDSRTVEFYIVTTKDGVYHKITLTQLSTDPFLTLDEHELEVGSRPRNHDVKLNTNIPPAAISVEMVYEQEAGDNWIVGVAVEGESLKFQTTLNTLPEERTATIILSYEDISGESIVEVWDKITVTQMASGNDGPPEVKAYSYVKGLSLGIIDENISVTGNIVSTGASNNFRPNTYILQNDNGMALAFEGIGGLSLQKYDKIHLLLDGAHIETFEDCGVQYRIIKGISAANILTSEADAGFTPPIVRISELTDDHLLAVVTLPDVEFAVPYGGYSNFHEFYVTQAIGNYATKHYPAPIRDIHGGDAFLITNREVSYRRKSVPKGSGAITGVVVKVEDSAYGNLGFSIRHLEESDIAVNANQNSGFSAILVEWELPISPNPVDGTSNISPTQAHSNATNATLRKDGATFGTTTGTNNVVRLIDKYRGEYTNPAGGNAITNVVRSAYNVNSWGSDRYWIMDNVSTVGITSSLSLQFEANSSTGNGPRDFAVEYLLDGNSWIRVATYQLMGQISTTVGTNVVPGYQMYTYRLPDELLNKANIKIRLLNINNTAVNGGATAIPGGTSRLGYFSIKYNK